jgi:glucose-6-phosphate 1-dehydrogenase
MDAINPLRVGLESERVAPPCVVVIFGASGDLTHRKLIPALYNLALSQLLGPGTAVVGCARRGKTDEQFRDEARKGVIEFSRRKPLDEAVWNDFAQGLAYVQGNFDDPAAYDRLREHLAATDRSRGTRGNYLFYLATPPDSFGPITEQLARARLIAGADEDERFTRVIIEKPFGTDLTTSRELDRQIHRVTAEKQIFRIDHYLGKEAVQNILAFRFANSIFEPLWHRDHVDHVQITVAEEIGVEGRGKFYEKAGVVRDIIQNHLLQLLMVLAMEPPTAFDAELVRDEKVKVLSALRPIGEQDALALTVRGQYGPGSLGSGPVPGYRQEPDVAPDSTTETFAAMKLHIDSWRWGSVPFYIRAGKRLTKRVTEIAVSFRQIPVALFRNAGPATHPNQLVMRIQPDEGITLRFASKVPGAHMLLRDVNMDFRYGATYGQSSPEAYERLLLDAILGDATLFARSDEVDAAWTFITPILHRWAENPRTNFPNYAAGAWGPREAEELIERDGRQWRRP